MMTDQFQEIRIRRRCGGDDAARLV